MKQTVADQEKYEIDEPTKEQLITELKEAIQELKAVEQGTKQARPLADLIKEL